MGKRLVNGKTSPAQVVDELHDAPAQCRRAAQGADECDGLHSQVLLRGFSVLYRGYSPKKRTVKRCAGRNCVVYYGQNLRNARWRDGKENDPPAAGGVSDADGLRHEKGGDAGI